jgi:hypothetical protein
MMKLSAPFAVLRSEKLVAPGTTREAAAPNVNVPAVSVRPFEIVVAPLSRMSRLSAPFAWFRTEKLVAPGTICEAVVVITIFPAVSVKSPAVIVSPPAVIVRPARIVATPASVMMRLSNVFALFRNERLVAPGTIVDAASPSVNPPVTVNPPAVIVTALVNVCPIVEGVTVLAKVAAPAAVRMNASTGVPSGSDTKCRTPAGVIKIPQPGLLPTPTPGIKTPGMYWTPSTI